MESYIQANHCAFNYNLSLIPLYQMSYMLLAVAV